MKKFLLLGLVMLLSACRTYPDYTGDFRFPFCVVI